MAKKLKKAAPALPVEPQPVPLPAPLPTPQLVAEPRPCEQHTHPTHHEFLCPVRGRDLTFVKVIDGKRGRVIPNVQALAAGDGAFHVRRRTLLTEQPAAGDILRDSAGREWIVKAARLCKQGERWSLAVESPRDDSTRT